MKRIILCFSVALLLFAHSVTTKGQRIAVKTNLLEWIVMSPNVGAEFVLGDKFSLEMDVAAGPFDFNKVKLRHFTLQPEFRFWTGRPMAGHYVGLTGFFSNYSTRFDKTSYSGDAFSIGASYGYVFVLGERLNLETYIGVGYLKSRNCKFGKGEECPTEPNNVKQMVAPIRLGVTLSYIIK
ncbi:MAG TPA: DUF3575 domain-containing protein [Candidatus Avibacteroides excrementipullorum]|nr:DUF3575 domain-containing protein [Candidatus Avibacteroides excrementipullorum]